MLPGLSGLDVCRTLRADPKTAAIPIIMVTAKADEGDRISGLELGADDYVSKPFSPNELMARIRALFRRMQRTESDTQELRYGPSPWSWRTHVVSLDGGEVKLDGEGVPAAAYLLQHPRTRAVPRPAAARRVGLSYAGGARTVDVHVRRLREKFRHLSNPWSR